VFGKAVARTKEEVEAMRQEIKRREKRERSGK
jgi:hypothetical protein